MIHDHTSTAPNTSVYLSPTEARAMLGGISKSTWHTWLDKYLGLRQCVRRLGGKVLVHRQELLEWFEGQSKRGA